MSLQAFTVFFWSLASVILWMLWNEEKLLKLEEEHDKKKDTQKKYKK